MVVCIPSLASSPETGKAFFCERLAKALRDFDDVTVISNSRDSHDISLHIVFLEETPVKAKRVLRLDGIYHNVGQNFLMKNKPIGNHLTMADGIIYQSNFCRQVAEKYLPPPKSPWEIIFNGADPSFYRNNATVEFDSLHNFIAYARWRPHKRLQDTIECYLHADIEDSGLFIAGDLAKCGVSAEQLSRYFKLPNVNYLGKLNQEQLAMLLPGFNASLHLAWIDWCPNSVVEAIAGGIPVITYNVGGTQELVAPSGGMVCQIDAPWDYSPCNLYDPPPLDRDVVAEALEVCSGSRIPIDAAHVDIHNIALRYKQFFEKVLKDE